MQYPNGKYKGKRKAKHRIAAEKALGRPLFKSYVVHHVDGDSKNWKNTNLVLCPDKEYHELLHKRTEAYYMREAWEARGLIPKSSHSYSLARPSQQLEIKDETKEEESLV